MADQFLGFDLSTQQLKGEFCPAKATPPRLAFTNSARPWGSGIVVGSDLKLIHEAKVDFDADLSKYGIEKGVLTNPAEGEVFAPVALFLEAIDLVLQRLKEQGADFSKVQGISGAGMQHGTVFWSNDAEPLLANLDAGKTLVEQLEGGSKGERKGAFSHPFSPNWQDASTQKQCEGFDKALQGPGNLALATGSSAHHVRFSIIDIRTVLTGRVAFQRSSNHTFQREISRCIQSDVSHLTRILLPRINLSRQDSANRHQRCLWCKSMGHQEWSMAGRLAQSGCGRKLWPW